jgi:hypothetical protein
MPQCCASHSAQCCDHAPAAAVLQLQTVAKKQAGSSAKAGCYRPALPGFLVNHLAHGQQMHDSYWRLACPCRHAAVHHPRLQQLLALPDGDTYLETVALLHGALLHGYNQAQHSALHTSSSGSSSEAGSERTEAASASTAAAVNSSSDISGDAAAQLGLGSYLATLPAGVPLPVFAGGGEG